MQSAVLSGFRADQNQQKPMAETPERLNFEELETIQAVQGGQVEEFVVLYDLYVEKIYKFLYFRMGHRQRAEDLTSQVFLQAFQKIQMFNQERGTFQAWLYRIARNLMIDEYRRTKPSEDIQNHFDLASDHNVESQVDQDLRAQAVQQFLQNLPQEEQDLIKMRLWDELSYNEIAEITGKTEGSLKMQFSRLIKKIQVTAPLLSLLILFLIN